MKPSTGSFEAFLQKQDPKVADFLRRQAKTLPQQAMPCAPEVEPSIEEVKRVLQQALVDLRRRRSSKP